MDETDQSSMRRFEFELQSVALNRGKHLFSKKLLRSIGRRGGNNIISFQLNFAA